MTGRGLRELLFRKIVGLFFKDLDLALPTILWLSLCLWLERPGLSPIWQGMILFGGPVAVLLGTTVRDARRTGR